MALEDWRNRTIPEAGTGPWVTVYAIADTKVEQVGLYSALVPITKREEVLATSEWELGYDDVLPGVNIWYENGSQHVAYEHFAEPNSIEPLVLARYFNGERDSYLELLEEFRLFHNLFHERTQPPRERYIRFTDWGDEETVAKVTGKRVEISLLHLKQFLAWKDMSLALYFDVTRFASQTLDQLGVQEVNTEHREGNLHYQWGIRKFDPFSRHFHIMAYLHGKKLIDGMPREETEQYPLNRVVNFQEFIIGIDEHGKGTKHTCNPDVLADYFGKNMGNPHYLTKVFFRKDVLRKYYSEAEKYEVADGHVSRRRYWSMRIDNNHPQYVIAFLGDLGRDLTENERSHWLTFNVIPDGEISEVTFRRGFLAEWTKPTDPQLVFKYRFRQFQEKWTEANDWPLFKPLHKNDEGHLRSLHVPLSEDFLEFDAQVLSLTKILVDSINESAIAKELKTIHEDGAKGIRKLELFLEERGVEDRERVVLFLRRLQNIRSVSPAHRKSRKHEVEIAKLGVDVSALSGSFLNLILEATAVLGILETLIPSQSES